MQIIVCFKRKKAAPCITGLLFIGMILLENLEVVKNRENDTYDEVNV